MDVIYVGKTVYLVETYGTVKINVQGGYITLSKVALAPSFMSNLVSLLLSRKQVY